MIRVFMVGFLLCNSAAWATEKLTYIDLVHRLTDLERLATLPEAGEKCAQFSSYERKSRYDAQTDKYVDWGANDHDGDSVIREENGASVLAEMAGPGVIWRIWSARPQQGHVKLYLDGSAKPAVDLPFAGYFDRQHEPFTYPALVHEVASGLNNYIPIPYNTSCKIVAEKGWGEFYHFTYTTYRAGTTLPTFSMHLTTEEKTALAVANTTLNNCGIDPAGPRANEHVAKAFMDVPPGQVATFLTLAGPAAITAIKVRVDVASSDNQRDALRDLVLRISWDNEISPSVHTPLGDFFGTAPGMNEYKSLPLGMTADGFYCYWFMPFLKSARVEVRNNGVVQRGIHLVVTHVPLATPEATLGRFHAWWHRDTDLPSDPQRQAIDWTLLNTQGRGRFVGVALHVWNPKGGWWGEGDEKFFIDGEKVPSTFGTGSEDFFGYAWCNPTPFQNAYHNQTLNTGNNRGDISVNRWFIADNVPFSRSFEGAIEKYYANDRPTLYDCVAYWYQTEPHKPCDVPVHSSGQIGKILDACAFFDDAKKYPESPPIDRLRATFKRLSGDQELVTQQDKLVLAMARIEKASSNMKLHDALLNPLVERLTVPFVDRDLTGEFRDVLPVTSDERALLVSVLVTDKDGDGSIKRVLKDGRWCIATERDAGKLYIYFALPPESKIHGKERTMQLRITYYSLEDNLPSVQYDSCYSDADKYYHRADRITPSDAKGWNTVNVPCPRACFNGRQNGESDFRIAAPDDNDIYIADVTVIQK